MKKLLSAALALAMGVTAVSTFAACGKKDKGLTDEQIAEKVVSGVRAMYIDKYSDTETPSDYDVVGQFPYEGVYYTLNWSVNVESGVTVTEMNATTKKVTIDVDEKTPTEVKYELTAAVTVGETKDSVTFKGLKVPAFTDEYTTHAQYAAAKKDDTVRVHGVVTGFASKTGTGASRNCIYFEDKDGGYYAYNLEALPDGLAVGDEIVVTGKIDTYQGSNQVVSATVNVLSKGNTVTAKDITETVKAAKDNKDATLLAYSQSLVTIKGAKLHNNTDDATYFPFKLANVDSYIRISTSDCPTGKDNQAAVKTAHAGNIGKLATVTGVATQYGGAFYLVPVGADAFKDFANDDSMTDADKVAEAKKGAANLIATRYKEVKNDIDLPAESYGATLTWSVKDTTDLVSITAGKLNILSLPTTNTDVTLKVAISSGSENDEAEVKITVVAPISLTNDGTAEHPLTIAEVQKIFAWLDRGETYSVDGAPKEFYIKGYVTVPGTTNNYGPLNVYFADDPTTPKADSALLYSANWSDEVKTQGVSKLDYGQFVTLTGYIMDYSGTKEISQTGSGNDAKRAYIKNVVAADLTDEQKVAIVKNNLTLPETVTADVAFPTPAIDGVTLSFASNKTSAIEVNTTDSKLVVHRGDNDEEVVITVTISCGSAQEATATFTVTVAKRVEDEVALTLTKESFNVIDDSQSGSYDKYKGDHTVGDYTVSLKDVMPSTYATYDVIQFKASNAGVMTLSGEFTRIVITYLATYVYDQSNPIAAKAGSTTLTPVNTHSEDTGLKANSSGGVGTGSGYYTLYSHTIEFTVTGSGEQEITLIKDTSRACYATKIEFYKAK